MIRIALAYPIDPWKQAHNLIDLERGNQLIYTFNDSESTADFLSISHNHSLRYIARSNTCPSASSILLS